MPIPNHIGSHFCDGWKIPLSLAVGVVLIFAMLVQLDQNSQQLELLHAREISISSAPKSPEEAYQAEESIANDISLFKRSIKEPDSQDRTDSNVNGSKINQSADQEVQPSITQIQPITNRKAEQQTNSEHENQEILQGGILKKAKPSNGIRFQDKSKPNEVNTQKLDKPSATKKKIESSIDDSTDSFTATVPAKVMQPKSIKEISKHKELPSSREDSLGTSRILDNEPEKETKGFAPVPVENWLLMIETLVARKDYAEAARQLEKFKKVHPKVNVEDLDAKIP